MKTASFAATLFLLAGNVLADPEPWMKKDNPNELAAVAYVRCDLVSRASVLELLEDSLIRARIKPLNFDLAPTALAITVTLNCSQNVYAYSIDFIEGKDGYYIRYGYLPINGAIGASEGDQNYILDSIRRQIDAVIADYLKANFDL